MDQPLSRTLPLVISEGSKRHGRQLTCWFLKLLLRSELHWPKQITCLFLNSTVRERKQDAHAKFGGNGEGIHDFEVR